MIKVGAIKKETSFQNFTLGYSNFCSAKCSSNDGNTRTKYKTTLLRKYGVDNISKLDDIKQLKKSTMLERYGGFFNNREQARETMLERYGYISTLSRPDVQNKILETRKNNFLSNNDEILKYDGEYWVMKCPHPDCNKCEEKSFKIKQGHYHDRLKINAEICTNLMPIKDNRTYNTTLELFVKKLLDEYKIKYVENDRSILGGKELDIYIPDKGIAIECNGCYWHNDFLHHEPKKHYEKWLMCRKKNIQLLTLWEDWIRLKPEILYSIIKSKLGLTDRRIYARKCLVKDLTPEKEIIKTFLIENHIQGSTSFEKGFGLYYGDELVSVMTFGHKRGCRGNNKTKEDEWELSRFCNKINTTVIGGAGKLLHYFEELFPYDVIYSYSSNDISDGNLYKMLNFEESTPSLPYWYIDSKTLKRYHRTSFTKKEIQRKGLTKKKNFTESEVMKQCHFFKIYDSGMTKWVKHR